MQSTSPAPSRNLYVNMSMKQTLDNPAVLEQQLEALEHHKKVLENQQRRLQSVLPASIGGNSSSSGGNYVTQSAAPLASKSMSYSTVGDGGRQIYENQQMLYENIKNNYPGSGISDYNDINKHASTTPELIYSNIMHQNNGTRNGHPYSNMSYEQAAHGGNLGMFCLISFIYSGFVY